MRLRRMLKWADDDRAILAYGSMRIPVKGANSYAAGDDRQFLVIVTSGGTGASIPARAVAGTVDEWAFLVNTRSRELSARRSRSRAR